MYARFAMQPAVIPDVTSAWEQDQVSDVAAVTSRRRLAASALTGIDNQRRHQQGPPAEVLDTAAARWGSRNGSGGRAGVKAAVTRWRLGSRTRGGWRYRRRKAAAHRERRAGRALAQFLDAAGQHPIGGSATSDRKWQQGSGTGQHYHRRRQRQHQQQAQTFQSEPADPQPNSADQPDPLPESMYPDLPPPMFVENAGADARRYPRRPSRAQCCSTCSIHILLPPLCLLPITCALGGSSSHNGQSVSTCLQHMLAGRGVQGTGPGCRRVGVGRRGKARPEPA